MKKITIIQSNVQETVNSAVIEKLYNLAFEDLANGIFSQLDPTSDVSGNIIVPSAYEDSVRYLAGIDTTDVPRFPNLHITVQNNNYYIRFADPVLQDYCSARLGDSIGVTRNEMSSIRTKNLFKNTINESALHTLEDFLYFTGISDYMDFFVFSGNCTIDKITFPRTQVVCGSDNNAGILRTSDGKITLGTIDWNMTTLLFLLPTSNLRPAQYVFVLVNIPYFNGIVPPDKIDLPPLFRGNGTLGKMIYPEGVVSTCDDFRGCYVTYVEFPTTVTNIRCFFDNFRRDAPNIQNNSGCVVFKSVIPPTTNGIYTQYEKRPASIYVPDGSVSAYQSQFSEYSSIIKPMSQMSQVEREMGTVTQADIDRV